MDCIIVKRSRGGSPWRRGLAAALLVLLGAGLMACHRKTPDELLKEAQDLYLQRDVIGAEMKYEKILQGNPTGPIAAAARYQLAYCYLKENEFDRGREELDTLIKEIGLESPDCFDVIALKINSYVMEKKPEKAVDNALATSPTLRGAPEKLRQNFQLLLAGLYLNDNKDDKANVICQQIIQEWPNTPELHSAALALMVRSPQAKKEYAKALAVFQEYLKTHPATTLRAEILSDIGLYLKNMNETAKAKDSFDASEAEYRKQIAGALGASNKTTLMFKLSRTQQVRGNLDAARQTLQGVIKEFPNSDSEILAKFMLSEISMSEMKYPDAITVLQEIIKERPDSKEATTAGQWIEKIRAQSLRQTSGTLAMTSGTLARTTGTLTRTSGTLVQPPAKAPAAAPASQPAPAAQQAATTRSLAGTPKP